MGGRSRRPRIALTMGDPAGIGPEVALAAATCNRVLAVARPILVGDPRVWASAAERLGIGVPLHEILAGADGEEGLQLVSAGGERRRPPAPGRFTRAGGRMAVEAIVEAVRLVRSGQADAVVTAPIAKASLAAAGSDAPGHTEFLARLTGARDVRMMMAGPRLRVVLVTTHLPLSAVPPAIRPGNVHATIALADRELRSRFGIAHPRLAVAGLNPHAGEGGMFGTEDACIIRPAVRRARRSGIDAEGPLPADACIPRAYQGHYDAVICMYHDQGLPAFKLAQFHQGVNVTLGLPFVRTSPDHGTAWDLAGTGRADPRSMIAAARLAARLARGRTVDGGTETTTAEEIAGGR